MYYLYRLITSFYAIQLANELNRNGNTNHSFMLNQKRFFWTNMMFHSQGMVFVGFGE